MLFPIGFERWCSKCFDSACLYFKCASTHRQVKFNNLTSLEAEAYTSIQPMQKGVRKCSILILVNLAYPEWLAVDCDEPLLDSVVCSLPAGKDSTKEKKQTGPKFKNVVCLRNHIQYNAHCLSVHYVQQSDLKHAELFSILSFDFHKNRGLKNILLYLDKEQSSATTFVTSVSIASETGRCLASWTRVHLRVFGRGLAERNNRVRPSSWIRISASAKCWFEPQFLSRGFSVQNWRNDQPVFVLQHIV